MEKKEESLKLYVWRGVLRDYTSGMIFALAESIEQARQLIHLKYCEERNIVPLTYPYTPDCTCYYCSEIRSEPEVFNSPVGFILKGGG
jgi:hypothetical protein